MRLEIFMYATELQEIGMNHSSFRYEHFMRRISFVSIYIPV
jgi:hypothetical protein